MGRLMSIDVVDSEKHIYSGEVEYIVAPAYNGEIGIFPYHVPLISTLKPGVLRLQMPNEQNQLVLAISGGFLEVQGNHVTVLADIVERTDELDEARLVEQKNAAEVRVTQVDSTMTTDVAKAHAALEIAIAQLKALDYLRRQAKR